MERNLQPENPGATKRIGQGLRLLVVEDHGDLSVALKAFFQTLGHRARFVGDVSSALHAAGEESFDVLLSDIGLPDGNGWDLLRRLHAAGRQPALAIAMSGFGMTEDLFRSRSAGYTLHLIKPFAPEDLVEALEKFQRCGPPILPGSSKRKTGFRRQIVSLQPAANYAG